MDDSTFSEGFFVGREEELMRLHRFVDRALNGNGSVCFLTGEPGAGKSTLLEEFSRRVRNEYPDLVFAAGDCNPQTGTDDPYLPFREILSDLTGTDETRVEQQGDTRRSRGFFQASAKMLVEHGPDLIDIFVPGGALVTRVGAQAASRIRSQKQNPSLEPSKNILRSDDLEQTHLLEQYTNVVLALAEQQPLMLLVDDLHWADEASINLLFHLSRRLSAARVLIIGAYRAHEITLGRSGQRHPLEATLNELKRYHGDIWIDLGNISASENRHFVDQVLDEECAVADEAFRSALFERTGGHALFTIELVQYLKECGYLLQKPDKQWEVSPELRWDGLPARVEGVISERITRLDLDEHDLLTNAAVIGESFSAEILAALLKREIRDVIRSLSGPLSKTHALLKVEGFERIAGRRMSVYGFKHNLIHKFFYESLDEIERGFIHEEAGLALESFFAGEPGVVAVQLARHFSESGITDKAVNYLVQAAHQARNAYAHAEAISHCMEAMRMLKHSSSGEFSGDWKSSTKIELSVLQGKALEISGEFASARGFFEQAIQETPESDRRSLAGLKREIATTHEREHQHAAAIVCLEEAASLLGDREDLLNEGEITEWISIHNNLLWIHYWQGNIDKMQSLISAIRETVEEHGSPAQKLRFFSALTGLENRLSRFSPSQKAIELSNQTLADIGEDASLVDRASMMFLAGFTQMHAGQHKAAADLIKGSLELAIRCGDRTQQARSLAYLSVIFRKLGEKPKVEKYLSDTEDISKALNMREYVAVVLANRSWIAWQDSKQSDAFELASKAVENWQNHSPGYPLKWLAFMPLIAIAQEKADLDQAVEYARVLIEPVNARLIGGVEEALQETVTYFDAGDLERTASCLKRSLQCSKDAGYL